MDELAISCIVPVRDGERYLAEALTSILEQTAPPLEVIVVDDGSTDGSATVAASFGAAVRVVGQAAQGVSRARNHGIELAQGELLAFLDADDVFLPQRLERQRARFEVHPELEMVAAHTVNFWDDDVPDDHRGRNLQHQEPWPRHLSTWLVRVSAFQRVGRFDESMKVSQDVDWHLRAQAAGVVTETLAEVLTRRRLHAGSATRDRREECREAVVQSVRRHLDRRRADGTDQPRGTARQ